MWPKLDSMVEGMHSHASPRSATDGLVSKHIVYASYSENYVQGYSCNITKRKLSFTPILALFVTCTARPLWR